jgi:hypothetical protein
MKKVFLFLLGVLAFLTLSLFQVSAQETASGALTQSGVSDSSGQTQS